MAPASVALNVCSSMSRFLTWPRSPWVTHTTAFSALRPVAKAFACRCGAIATVGIGSPARCRSRSTTACSWGASAGPTTQAW